MSDKLSDQLVNALFDCSKLRHGLFTPREFRALCRESIAARVDELERQRDELLDAALELDRVLPGNGPTAHPAVQMLRDAIAKAKGEADTESAPKTFSPDPKIEAWLARAARAGCGKTLLRELRTRAGQPVEIFHSTEFSATGDWVAALENGFWMEAMDTEEEIRRFVADMGWPLIGEK